MTFDPDIEEPPNLRRAPHADGLDPAGPPPALLWESRETRAVGDGQYRITVPCALTAPVAEGVHVALTEALRRRWVDASRARCWRITNVVAAFDAYAGRRAQLTVAITALPATTPPLHGPDDRGLARDLGAALATTVLSTADAGTACGVR